MIIHSQSPKPGEPSNQIVFGPSVKPKDAKVPTASGRSTAPWQVGHGAGVATNATPMGPAGVFNNRGIPGPSLQSNAPTPGAQYNNGPAPRDCMNQPMT